MDELEYIEAVKNYLTKNDLNSLKDTTVYFYKNKHYSIGEFQIIISKRFASADPLTKVDIAKKFESLPYEFLTLKLFKIKKEIKETKKIETKKKQSKKTFTIPAFRVSEEVYQDYIKRLKDLNNSTKKVNNTTYMTNLIIQDSSKKDKLDTLEIIEREELIKEIRFLLIQTSKIGSNINQITHGINIIKRKKSRNLNEEDKQCLINYYEQLKIFSKRYALVTKKITNLKIF